ncbi:AAA family ATPase [Aliiroseovarius sp. S1339]|uniref:adenylate/guanylate cyclase domain-containing protein n=1 Tax=Aliiroseovarius sp. S1339 TaxID=2936990 RepID=UPI0020BDAB7E|nr:adenylate/guanylate cyclase domain-containing protein [Aliiroseovarius sp. S1339]MCK8462778.1 AAA family ATPase [Aliiroseovarius sp. S1339]
MQVMNCLACSAPLAQGAKFCGNCGAEVVVDAQNPEVRVLTIQFIDMVGSTAYASHSELEDYDNTISAFHRLVNDVVTTYRGTVLQRYGDGVLSCFGLGQDSEDAALSAIAAGLSIAKTAPERLHGQNVRVGVDSGQVMCRVGQSGTLFPQLAGLHVNRAARLQEQAPTGGVVISGETQTFLSRLAELDITSQEKVALKGIDAPVDVIGVAGFSFLERLDTGRALLERDKELSILLGDTSTSFALIGPAGIGKSALLAELVRSIAPSPVIQMDARANLKQSALFPIAEAVRTELFLPSTSQPDAMGSALATIGIALDKTDLNLMAGVLGLTGATPVNLTPEQQKARRIELMTGILGKLAGQKHAALAFDDFHWADEESTAVLRNLIDDPQFTNRLFITSRRTEKIVAWVDDTAVHRVDLHPLSNAAAQKALDAYPELTKDRRKSIIAGAEGNPLFLLALAEHARQMGGQADELPLPQTIEATFQAIINGLGPLKDVVQCLSVLGRVFDPEHARLLLPNRNAIDDELRVLTINGVLHKRRDGLAFDHILLRDAAYEMLPGKRRRALHLRFAEQVKVHDPELCAKLPELLADHLLAAKAHNQIPAACIAAGVHMLRGANFDPAIKYLDRARIDMEKQAGGKPVTRDEHLPVLSLLASAQVQRFGFSHPTVLESYEKLESAVSHAKGTDRQRMVALYGLFAHRIISGNVDESGELVDKMREIAHGSSDELSILWLVNKTAQRLYAGDFTAAQASSDALKRLYRVEDHGMLFVELGADPLASVLSADAHILVRKGDKDGALAAIEAAKHHLNAIGATAQLPWIHIFGAQAFFEGGHMALAHSEVLAGIDIADEQRADFWSLVGRLWQSLLRIHDGDLDTAPAEFEAYVGHASASGVQLNLPFYKAVLAKATAARGDLENAKKLLREAADLIEARGEREWASRINAISAEIHGVEAVGASGSDNPELT